MCCGWSEDIWRLIFILLFDIWMNLQINTLTCFLIIMCLFYIFFCIFPVQTIWWICKQHFLRSWFGINQLNTPFGKNWLPRESSQQESCLRASLNKARCNKRLVWPWCHICSDMFSPVPPHPFETWAPPPAISASSDVFFFRLLRCVLPRGPNCGPLSTNSISTYNHLWLLWAIQFLTSEFLKAWPFFKKRKLMRDGWIW